MEDLYINFTASITRLNKLVQRIKSYEISKYGLQPIHVSCGYYLSKNPQGLTAKELCELAMEDKAAISRALKTLQEKGIVKYLPRGRNEIVQLTKEGEKLSAIISERINSAVKAGCANITDEERKFFYNSLLEISNNLIGYYQKLIQSEE
ncbi:MAG: MarR family winged helix-turn-helix transcriptional regulator [Clostridia bacterium]|nr:MarR family winged helix-turn-helix transcriptional regulator [Clostridia bacterium]